MLNILENGVSAWPMYDGRFPLVSGVKFKFDGRKPVGSRVEGGSLVTDEGKPVEMEKL